MRKFLLSLCLLCMSLTTAKASDDETFLLYGETMTVYIMLTLHDNDQIDVVVLPDTLMLPITCANTIGMLGSLSNEKGNTCLIDSIEQTYQVPIDHYLYLHTQKIDTDFAQTYRGTELTDLERITTYFDELSNQADFSILWKYQNYLATDLNLWDLKDLFPIFTKDDLNIEYQNLHMIYNDGHWFSLDKTIYD